MRIKATVILIILMLATAPAAFADSTDILLNLEDCVPGEVMVSDSGESFAVNGGFNLSFYFPEDTDATLTVTAAAIDGGRYGLIFINETAEGTVYFEDAPDMEKAADGGTFKTKESNKSAPYRITESDFNDYTFNVTLKKGINTVYVPPYDLTDQCGNFVYVTDGIKCNRGVCFKSIRFKSRESKTIYVCDMDTENLTYHSNGYIVAGMDADNPKDGRTVTQTYEAMYTRVPFEVYEDGDYIVNIRYNTYSFNDMLKTIPAAVYLDADTGDISGKDWLRFLSKDYPYEKRKEFTDEKLRTITAGGAIKPIDLGTWKTCFSVNGDAQTFPYYNIKSFKLSGLKSGQHTLLFYTAKGILDSESDVLVNRAVSFNSFEIRKLTEENMELNTFFTYVVTDENWGANKFCAAVPEERAELGKPLKAVITVANNREEALKSDLRFAYYNTDKQLVSVKDIPIHLKPYESFEDIIVLKHPQNVGTLKVFLTDSESLKPYITVKALSLK